MESLKVSLRKIKDIEGTLLQKLEAIKDEMVWT